MFLFFGGHKVIFALTRGQKHFLPDGLILPDVLRVSPNLTQGFPILLVGHAVVDFQEGIEAIGTLMPEDVLVILCFAQRLSDFLFLDPQLFVVDVVEVRGIENLFDQRVVNLLTERTREQGQFGVEVNDREFM